MFGANNEKIIGGEGEVIISTPTNSMFGFCIVCMYSMDSAQQSEIWGMHKLN